MADEPIRIEISGPVSAAISDISKAVVAVCEVMKTPEGQASMKAAREGSEEVRATFKAAWDSIVGLFK